MLGWLKPSKRKAKVRGDAKRRHLRGRSVAAMSRNPEFRTKKKDPYLLPTGALGNTSFWPRSPGEQEIKDSQRVWHSSGCQSKRRVNHHSPGCQRQESCLIVLPTHISTCPNLNDSFRQFGSVKLPFAASPPPFQRPQVPGCAVSVGWSPHSPFFIPPLSVSTVRVYIPVYQSSRLAEKVGSRTKGN